LFYRDLPASASLVTGGAPARISLPWLLAGALLGVRLVRALGAVAFVLGAGAASPGRAAGAAGALACAVGDHCV